MSVEIMLAIFFFAKKQKNKINAHFKFRFLHLLKVMSVENCKMTSHYIFSTMYVNLLYGTSCLNELLVLKEMVERNFSPFSHHWVSLLPKNDQGRSVPQFNKRLLHLR